MKKIIPVLKGDIPEKKEKGFVMNPAETVKPTIAFNVTIKDEVEEPSVDEMENLASLEDDDIDRYEASDDDMYAEEEEEDDEEDSEDEEDDEYDGEDDAYDEDDTSDDEEEENEEDDPEDRKEDLLNIDLLNVSKLGRSISKISNMIKEYIHAEDVYGMISDYVTRKKYYADEFYQKVQNSIYHTLMEYCKVSKSESGEEVVDMEGMTFERFQTLRFFDRVYNDRNVSRETDPMKLPAKYMKEYGDTAYMIDPAWIDLLNFRLTPRIPIPDDRIKIIGNVIQDGWCKVPEKEDVSEKAEECHCEHCASEDEDFVRIRPMRLYRYKAKDSDVLYVASDDGIRVSIIPFYEFHTYENMNVDLQENGLVTHEKNGDWDWLTHFRPGTRFMTKDCDKYLALNDMDVSRGIVSVILSEEEDGYLMGMYRVPPANIDMEKESALQEYTEKFLRQINRTISSCISAISYLPQNTQYTEEEKKEILANGKKLDAIDINYEESDSHEESDAPDLTEAVEEEKSAVDVDMADIAAQFLVGDDEVMEEYDDEGEYEEDDYEEYDSDSFEFSPIRKKHKMS